MKTNIFGFIKLSAIIFIIITIGLYPVILYSWVLYHLIDLSIWWHWLFFPLFFYLGFLLTFYGELLISGSIIRLFHICYKPGKYTYSFKDKNVFRWIVVCSLYTPFRKLMEIFPIGGIKNIYYRLLGMKIGENTLVGGVIKDPCMTSMGSNTTMGEYAIIYAHITNYADESIIIEPVVIGNNCIIGASATIMPGVTIEDNVIVAAGAVVTQGQHLKSNHVYTGIPAKPLSK